MPLTQSETREAVQGLEVIASDPRVALRLIELARNPEAQGSDYAGLIQADPSLCARLLGIVNSAWYSPGSSVQSVTVAIGMLGVPQVRMISLSHSVASLHQSMAVPAEEEHPIWRGSVIKAIAARKVAERMDGEDPEARYAAGLIQDLGLSALLAVAPQTVRRIHGIPGCSHQAILAAEQGAFGLDHASVGGMIGQKLDLPMAFMHSMTCHHGDSLEDSGAIAISLPCKVASALPHDGSKSSGPQMFELRELLKRASLPWQSAECFLTEVFLEFERLNTRLGCKESPTPDLLESLRYASQEYVRGASDAVSQNIWLREGKSSLHQKLNVSERAHHAAEQRADRDPLTQLFNRTGWDRRARQSLSQSRSDTNLGVAFFDLDHFKQLNDQHGHSVGDAFLKAVSARMQEATRTSDIVCRWGGDEFVVLFIGGKPGDCLEAAHRVQRHMQEQPITVDGIDLPVSTSVGFVSVESRSADTNLGDLLQLADEQLYKAKGAARGTLSATVVA